MNKSGLVREAGGRTWVTPALEFKGNLGAVLQSGGGKLSVTGADSGEMRCEKPHSNQCN